MTELNTAFKTTRKYVSDALYLAVCAHDIDMVAGLLEYGSNPDEGEDGRFPLLAAAERGYTSIARLLLDKGATLNIKNHVGGWTPVMFAACRGHVETVRLFIEKGAALDEVTFSYMDTPGETALIMAARKGYVDIVRLLVEGLADINKTDTVGNTAFIVAGDHANDSYRDRIKTEIRQILTDAPAVQERVRQNRMHERIAIKQQKFKARAGNRKVIPGGPQ